MKKLRKRKEKAGTRALNNPFHIDLCLVANQEMKTHAHHKGKLSQQ